jgi:hypothetical protein
LEETASVVRRRAEMTTDEDDDSPPGGPLDQALRETMLRRASPRDRKALIRVAWMLFSYLLEQREDEDSGGMREALLAAGRDVRHLAGFLLETAEVYQEDGLVGNFGKDLVMFVRTQARRLGRIADALEVAVDFSFGDQAEARDHPEDTDHRGRRPPPGP